MVPLTKFTVKENIPQDVAIPRTAQDQKKDQKPQGEPELPREPEQRGPDQRDEPEENAITHHDAEDE
jgi:hypothetical protein